MDELTIPGVNTGVGNAAAAGACEQDDVAHLQGSLVHLCSGAGLGGRSAANGNAEGAVNIINKAGAVKAAGGSTAVNIGTSQVALGFGKNLCAGCRAMIGGSDGGTEGCTASGNSANGLALAEIFGLAGRSLIFIGDFCQAEEIAADVAGLVVVQHLVPAVVYADDVTFFTLGGGCHPVIGCIGAAAQIHAGAGDHTIAQLCVFGYGNIDIVGAHIANLKIVADLVPAVLAVQHHNALAGVGGGEHLRAGIGGLAQIEAGGIYKSDAVHQTVIIGMSLHGKTAGKNHQSRCQCSGSRGKLHT